MRAATSPRWLSKLWEACARGPNEIAPATATHPQRTSHLLCLLIPDPPLVSIAHPFEVQLSCIATSCSLPYIPHQVRDPPPHPRSCPPRAPQRCHENSARVLAHRVV